MARGRRGHSNAVTREQDLRALSQPRPMRGSTVLYRSPVENGLRLGVVVSNDVQNESSDVVLVVPLERRKGRLRAPFAVDLGRNEGFRDLFAARCDWLSRVSQSDIVSIERAGLPTAIIDELERALKIALGFRELI